MSPFAFRLTPGQDLKRELLAFAAARNLHAAAVVTCVGSLTTATLRYAQRDTATVRHGHFEIVSLVGTLSADGCHLHIALADGDGNTFGGHVLDGCTVFTTAEIVLLELPGVAFRRAPDPATGYNELVIEPTGS